MAALRRARVPSDRLSADEALFSRFMTAAAVPGMPPERFITRATRRIRLGGAVVHVMVLGPLGDGHVALVLDDHGGTIFGAFGAGEPIHTNINQYGTELPVLFASHRTTSTTSRSANTESRDASPSTTTASRPRSLAAPVSRRR
jgi:hypothetical protein